MTSQDAAAAAERLRARGLTVFPLVPNEKHPAVDNWQTADHGNAIRPNSNVGCFARDVFVIDFDTKKGAAGAESYEALLDMAAAKGAEPTYTQRTPTGGYHAFYRTQADIPNSAKTVDDLPGVDIRGTQAAGYVVGAGSAIDGVAYTVEVDAPIAQAPDWLVEMITRRARKKADNAQEALVELDLPVNVEKAKNWLLNDAWEAVEGSGGDDATYRVAVWVRDLGISESLCLELMLDNWNDTKAAPPWLPEDLQVKVTNAYKHAQNPAGIKVVSDLEPVEIDETKKAPTAGLKFRGDDLGEVDEDLTVEDPYLIEGVLEQQTMIVVYGESGAGKTHVALDQSLAIASGRQWGGKRVKAGLVVYVAAEGGRGIRRRVMAHKRKYGLGKETPFALIRFPVDLLHPTGDTKHLTAAIRDAVARFGQGCALVVIDTLSRALAGGDENSSVDMGAIVKNCDQVRHDAKCALLLVHHSGKNKASGARGHSLLRAAVDTEIEVENGAIKCRKQRDMEASDDLRFDYEPVAIGANREGVPVRSVVLRVWEPTEFDVSLTPAGRAFWKDLSFHVRNTGVSVHLPTADLVTVAGTSRAAANRLIEELTDNGIVEKSKHGHYTVLREYEAS